MPPSAASRKNKQPNPAGYITFVGLRALSPIIQYGILAKGLGDGIVTSFGGTVLPDGPPAIAGLPLSIDRTLLVAMTASAAIKHICHATFLATGQTEVSWALEQNAYNDISDTISSLIFICAQLSPATKGPFPRATMVVGVSIFVVGLAIELIAEHQRHFFKQEPANKGKLHQGGLFGLSRHINYFGFTLWRTGLTVASCGWPLGAITAASAAWSFLNNSIPDLDKYLAQKYGQQFEEYKKAVPYAYVPWLV